MKILNPKYEILNKLQILNFKSQMSVMHVWSFGLLEFGACLGFRNSNLDITGGIDE
jgi:hypothetical protein